MWTHGGAVVDFAENVSRGHDDWREPYLAQGEHKREQIERMIRYAESNQCRMASVVRHFGDLADGEKPCGICDYCAPATVHRATLPHRDRGGARGAVAGGRGVARGRREIHRQALRRTVSPQRDEPATNLGNCWEAWRARESCNSRTRPSRKMVNESRTVRPV